MNFYGAAVREVLPAPDGRVLVRFWPPSPHPRVYILAAFAKALDAVVSRTHGPACCAAVYRPHPEAISNAIDVVIPACAEPAQTAQECIGIAAEECHAFMLAYHDQLVKSIAAA